MSLFYSKWEKTQLLRYMDVNYHLVDPHKAQPKWDIYLSIVVQLCHGDQSNEQW